MSSEMRELVEKWHERVDVDPTNDYLLGRSEMLVECASDLLALLARTEAGADGAVMEIVEKNGFKHLRLPEDKSLTSMLDFPAGTRFYTHPQDASGDAVDWKWQYRFQTVMRFMDNGATREAAERAALIDIAALESAAMQAKEAK